MATIASEEYSDGEWFRIKKALFLLPLLLGTSVLFIRWLSKSKLNIPKGPTGLPVVGYLPFLGKEPYKTFDRLKEKYGNVFRIKLGLTDVIILADYPAIEEALSKNATAYRPPGLFDFLPDGFGLAGDNGEKWVQHRRFVLRTMRDIGLTKTTWMTHVLEQLSDFLNQIARKNGEPMDITIPLSESISNNITSLICGKRLEQGPKLDSFIKSADAVSKFFAQSSLWLYFPSLCKILSKAKGSSYYKTLGEMMIFHGFFRDELDRHVKNVNEVKGDFFAEYLEAMEINNTIMEKKQYLSENDLIGDSQVLFIGGSDTTRASLFWLFLCMAKYPEVQDKVFAELESVLGNQKLAAWEDRLKFPYTYAVILEGQRFKTTVPLNPSRMAGEDFKIFNWDIPKGCNIISNNWSMHNDPRYWPEPETFKPERFLHDDGSVNLKPKSYCPFSFGRRKCPGELVAMMELFLYFTAVIQKFRIQAPKGREVSLDGHLGIIYIPVSQQLCFAPRQ